MLWLDVPVEVGLSRSTKRAAALHAGLPQEQRFEQLSQDYHNRVRSGFAALAAADRRMIRIDALQDIDAVTAAIAGVALP